MVTQPKPIKAWIAVSSVLSPSKISSYALRIKLPNHKEPFLPSKAKPGVTANHMYLQGTLDLASLLNCWKIPPDQPVLFYNPAEWQVWLLNTRNTGIADRELYKQIYNELGDRAIECFYCPKESIPWLVKERAKTRRLQHTLISRGPKWKQFATPSIIT